MKIFNLSMLVICALSCGMALMASEWIASGFMALCIAYWFVKLAKTDKTVEKEFEINISDEAKELLKSKDIKVVVNGKEII